MAALSRTTGSIFSTASADITGPRAGDAKGRPGRGGSPYGGPPGADVRSARTSGVTCVHARMTTAAEMHRSIRAPGPPHNPVRPRRRPGSPKPGSREDACHEACCWSTQTRTQSGTDCSCKNAQNLCDSRNRVAGVVEEVGRVQGLAGQFDGKIPVSFFHRGVTAAGSVVSGSSRLPTVCAVSYCVPLITAATASDTRSIVRLPLRSVL